MGQSLYELTEEMVKLDTVLEAAGGVLPEGEEGQRLSDMLEKYAWLEREKVDGYGAYWANLKALIESIESEEERLKARRHMAMAKIERLKDMARLAMERRNRNKLEGNMFTISLQKNGGKPPMKLLIEKIENLPEKYQKKVVLADTEKIRADLENGSSDAQAVAEILPVGYSVRIR